MTGFDLFKAIFTLIQLIINHRSGKPTEYPLVLNVITFTVVTMGMLIHNVKNLSFNFYSYSLGVLCVHLILIIGMSVLYAISQMLAKKRFWWYYYPISLILIIITAMGITAMIAPSLFTSTIESSNEFFATSVTGTTVAEMKSGTIKGAFISFNWSLLLAAGGFIFLPLCVWKREEPETLFVLI
jgi:asparagine N-glycosylation enzyme membrane subunit Stt3